MISVSVHAAVFMTAVVRWTCAEYAKPDVLGTLMRAMAAGIP